MKIYIMSANVRKDTSKMKKLYWGKTHEELKEIKSEIKAIYDKHTDNEGLEELTIEYYAFIFFLLLSKKNITISKDIEEEAKRLYNNNLSEKVAERYIFFLALLPLAKRKGTSDTALVESQKVYEAYPNSEFIVDLYFTMFLNLFTTSKIEENLIYEKIGNVLSSDPLRIVNVDKLIYKLMRKLDDKKEYSWKICGLIEFLARKVNYEEILNQSKYRLLYDGYNNLTNVELTKIIEIWSLVQKIKEQLIIKNPEELRFGHYTSGTVLQSFLKQKEEKEKKDKKRKNNTTNMKKYSIVTKSRLNNVNYMNDPSEGKVLDQCLGLETINQKLSLKPSPWFLMSLTTAIDQLTMWSQYGDQAKGVCLVLDSGDFAEVEYPSDIELLMRNYYSERLSKELKDSNIMSKSETKDFIYRIGYLTTQKESGAELKSEYNTRLGEKEIKTINKSLSLLKESVKGIDKGKELRLYEKVDECLEEIRYLFKSADYSYESELRVLKYMPLEPDNQNIKIDDSGEFAKLYIERENPIKLSEVIFGPKFPNPENVTPLLYLLDKNIKFRQSEISFR